MADDRSIEPPPLRGPARPGEDGRSLVVEVVGRHAESLLRLARRHSLCASDAEDAYQRGLEIFIRHSARLDPERAASWLRTVVKHEAMAVRRTRQRDLAPAQYDFDAVEASSAPTPDEQVAGFERVARSAEALGTLKPQEVRALWLRAQGNSYEEIQEATGWTRTKVNRCLYEGRRAFLRRYAGIEAGDECRRWEPSLSALVDGEATQGELMALRPHLRSCSSCRAAVREIHRSSRPVAAVFPVALAAGTADAGQVGQGALRAWEAVVAWLAERAAATVTRAQALMELLVSSAGKGTAVVAAGAAIASGSTVVIEQSGAGPAPSRPGASMRAGLAAETGRALQDARRAARRQERRREAAEARTRAAATARPAPAVAAPAPAPAVSPEPAPAEPAPAAGSGAEFGLE